MITILKSSETFTVWSHGELSAPESGYCIGEAPSPHHSLQIAFNRLKRDLDQVCDLSGYSESLLAKEVKEG